MNHKIKELVTKGQPHYGRHHQMIEHLNLLDRTLKFPIPKRIRKLRLKEWEAIQIFHKDFFLISAVLDAKMFGVVQSMCIDRRCRKKHIFHKKNSRKHILMSPHLFDTVTEYEDNEHYVSFRNRGNDNLFEISIQHEKNMILHGEGHLNSIPLSIYYPFHNRHSLYSCKMVMPFNGHVTLHGKTIPLDDAIMIIDDHKGFYPYDMKYQWATAATYIDGHLMAFNFTHNDLINDDTNNENALWIDDTIYHFKSVAIKPSEENWAIKDKEGKVNLIFTPEFDYLDHHDYGIIKTHYESPAGYFNGTIQLDNQIIHVNNWYGMTENIHHKI